MVREKCCRNTSAHNEEKSVAAERVVRTLNNNIYKYMATISKNVYIDKLAQYIMNITIHTIAQLK